MQGVAFAKKKNFAVLTDIIKVILNLKLFLVLYSSFT